MAGNHKPMHLIPSRMGPEKKLPHPTLDKRWQSRISAVQKLKIRVLQDF